MTSIEELERADSTLARHRAEVVWKDNTDGSIPVFVLPLIKALCLANLSTTELPQSIRGACIELEQGEGGIMYNPNASFLSKRWTVAHEIGHWCLGHVSSFGSPTSHIYGNQEIEANAFASALLVPPSDLRKYAKQNRPTIADIQARYLVTSQIAIRAADKAGVLMKYIRA